MIATVRWTRLENHVKPSGDSHRFLAVTAMGRTGERVLLRWSDALVRAMDATMDAASWKTSQELGVLIESRVVVEEFKKWWKYEKLEP